MRNKTIKLTDSDRAKYTPSILDAYHELLAHNVICGNCFDILPTLPANSIDLLILDPPYNLDKNFNGVQFVKRSLKDYNNYLHTICLAIKPLLKPNATVYICGDWYTSVSIFTVASHHFTVRNRITWEREKGRGAKTNWKNSSEDIWFCTVSDDYVFNVDDVKMRRKVLAPYTDNGAPKDWVETAKGNFRDTYPSNLWTDITIPFWSMPENTDHPTQKSEKLLAKLILASSNPGSLILDPFAGSGSTLVTAEKLDRYSIGIEQNLDYCLLTMKRLDFAQNDKRIQGFKDNVFWERNSL